MCTGLIHHTLVPIDPVFDHCIRSSILANITNWDEGVMKYCPYYDTML